MKFYSTVLIAILLFGLCLIERKAKEKDLLRNTFPESSGDNDLKQNPWENTTAMKYSGSSTSGLTTSFVSDTARELTPKPLLNISLNALRGF